MFLAVTALFALSQDKGLGDMKASEVVEWMTKHTKVRFIAGDGLNLAGKKILATPETLDPARAYENGLKMLKAADLAAISNPETPGVVEIVAAPIAGKKTSTLHTSTETLPKADEYCTLSLRLKHVSPRNVQAALINLASFPQNVLSVEESRSVILSDYSSNLRRMGEIARQMDVPPPPSAFRISITVLEGTKGGDPSVPDAFKDLDLPKATGLARFKVVGETLARLEVPAFRTTVKTPAPSEAVLRMSGPPAMRVELGGPLRGGNGPDFERFTFLLERPDAPLGLLALQTRLEFKDEKWVLVGVAPSESQLASLVVLARATPEK